MTPEALAALEMLLDDIPGAGLLVVTSADRLHADWLAASRAAATTSQVVAPAGAASAPTRRWSPSSTAIRRRCPGSAAWRGHRVVPLGVEHFGQSGDIPDLYRAYRLDADAILDAAARACLDRR